MVSIAGIDHVGIGCDFDGGGGIDGVFDASEAMQEYHYRIEYAEAWASRRILKKFGAKM